MPDIVPNLLRLSSEAVDVASLLEPALDLVLTATGADAAAFARATLPAWSVEAARGVTRAAVPLDLAAEAANRGEFTTSNGWFATPISGVSRDRASAEPEFVLLVHGKCTEPQVQAVANRVADALVVVERQARAAARVDRLQTILAITHEWHQTNEMQTLLTRMAEAATRLLDADRASIFLWDKPNKTIDPNAADEPVEDEAE